MTRFSSLLAFILVIIASCSSNDDAFESQKKLLSFYEPIDAQPVTDEVSSAEVNNIIKSLFKNDAQSRSSIGYTVSLIKDTEGIDRIICVNFDNNKGYVLISAEKTHEPILAFSEEGNFKNSDNLPFPLKDWLDCNMKSIAASKSLPVDSLKKISEMWHRYEIIKPAVKSRAYDNPHSNQLVNMTWDEYYAMWNIMKVYVNDWQSKGYRVYEIDNYTNPLSFGEIIDLHRYAQGYVFPTYYEDYWAITLIVEKDLDYESKNGRRLITTWNQKFGYNQSFKETPKTDKNDTGHEIAGCGPVALGQVMYHFGYPTYINWTEMSTGLYGNKITSDFLLDIFTKCGSEYNEVTGQTSTNFNKMYDVLKSFGYSCNKVKMSGQNFSTFPVIVCSELDGEGHAWIIDSSWKLWGNTDVEIWTFMYPEDFTCIYSESINYFNCSFYTANWGWGYYDDSYYLLSNFVPKAYENSISKNVLKEAIVNINH